MPSSSSLRSTLDSLASSFAIAVLDAIRTASLDELRGESGSAVPPRGRGRPKRSTTRRAVAARPRPVLLTRRTPEQLAKLLALVVAAVRTRPMRAEEIRRHLNVDKRELPRVLHEGLKTKQLTGKGQRRGTTYSG